MPSTPDHIKAKILVVEDEVIIGADLTSRLINLGYSICEHVTSGEKAIEMVERERPDLVLMDIILQGKMDGLATAELIRERFDTPVIFCTAYADEERLEKAKLVLPFGYVLKPFQDRDLRITIEMALYVARVDAERRNAEEERQALASIVENNTDFVGLATLDGHVTYVNEAGLKIVGLQDIDAARQTTIFDYVSPEKISVISEQAIPAVMTKGYWLGENQFRHFATGNQIQMDINVFTIKNSDTGEPVSLAIIARNISARKQTEQELASAEKRFRTLFQLAPEAIFVQDMDGKIIDANQKAIEILGYSREELLSLTVSDIDVNIKSHADIRRIRNELTYSKAVVFRTSCKGKNGRFINMEVNLSPIELDGRNLVLAYARKINQNDDCESC